MIRGWTFDSIIIDEFTATLELTPRDLEERAWGIINSAAQAGLFYRNPHIVERFQHANEPSLTVEIHEIEIAKRDPRNPNPAAGKQKAWRVMFDGHQLGPNCGTKDEAVRRGHGKFRAVVKRYEAERIRAMSANPIFGTF